MLSSLQGQVAELVQQPQSLRHKKDIHDSGGKAGRVDRVKEFVPMKRGGEVLELAEAIMWLLSDQASYSTGTFIDVAGGR